MWYEWQLENSPSKSLFVKVNHHRPKYGLQHGALAHTEQQTITCIKVPKNDIHVTTSIYITKKIE